MPEGRVSGRSAATSIDGAFDPRDCDDDVREVALPETIEARAAHHDSADRRAAARERRSGKMGAGGGRVAEKLAEGATKRATR